MKWTNKRSRGGCNLIHENFNNNFYLFNLTKNNIKRNENEKNSYSEETFSKTHSNDMMITTTKRLGNFFPPRTHNFTFIHLSNGWAKFLLIFFNSWYLYEISLMYESEIKSRACVYLWNINSWKRRFFLFHSTCHETSTNFYIFKNKTKTLQIAKEWMSQNQDSLLSLQPFAAHLCRLKHNEIFTNKQEING